MVATEERAKPVKFKSQKIPVKFGGFSADDRTVSIGITVYPHDDHSIDELLKHADSAMYRAKQQGGSGFAFHEASGYNHAATYSAS